MRSKLVVTVAATDLSLLNIIEMRMAAGLAVNDSSQDVPLAMLEEKMAAAICTECGIAVGQGGEPTLRRETLTETFYGVCASALMLSRRHYIAIASVTVDGSSLSSDDWDVDTESGILTRLSSWMPTTWSGTRIVVVYDAGFTKVPADLKMAASEALKLSWASSQSTTAEGVKRQTIRVDDIEEIMTEYFDGSSSSSTSSGGSSSGAVPDAVVGKLERFKNYAIG